MEDNFFRSILNRERKHLLKNPTHTSLVRKILLCFSVLIIVNVVNSQSILDSLFLKEKISIYFESDSSSIQPMYADSVKKIFSSYKENEIHQLIIEAHTDSIGSIEYNNKLSDRRAQSSINYLKEIGVEADSIKVVGLGELHPLMSNNSEAGRSKNRRVDIGFFTTKKFGLLSGKIVTDSTEIPIPATLILRSKEHRDTIQTDSSGIFTITTPLDEVVVLEATARDHFFINKPIKITPGILKNGISIKMPKVESGKKFELENFYFVGNKPVLLPNSVPVLHRLLEFMKLNPEICIRIDGHINLTNQGPVSKNSWHWKLSDDRTKTVYNFLVKNGIDGRRMKRRAFANWEMVYPRATTEKFMKKNRRVELLIIDCTAEGF